MTIEPHGDHIKGECKLTLDSEGNKIERAFNDLGIYRARLLSLTFEEGDKETDIRDVTALRLDTQKKSMQGYNLYWHHDKFEWKKQEFSLKRIKS